MAYDFLILDLIFAIPVLVILAVRRDLAPVMKVCALASLPFALTEVWFYPTYWEPHFLFDLGTRWGFGLEDFLFVSVLAAFASTAYAAVFRQTYERLAGEVGTAAEVFGRAGGLVTAALAMAAVLALADVPMIYGAVGIMMLLAGCIVVLRRDLAGPAFAGGWVCLAIYVLLCQGFAGVLPGVFDLTWHAERFSNCQVLGVPLEELLYGFACGTLATVFYPFVTGRRFVPRGRCTHNPKRPSHAR